MSTSPANPRKPEADVDTMFIDRWSPRAFLPDPIPPHRIKTLFEAARWSPSCYNEQPWLVILYWMSKLAMQQVVQKNNHI